MHISFLKKKNLWNGFVAMALPKQEEKKLLQLVCGNATTKIGGKNFVAMTLPKMGGKKKNSGWSTQ